MSRLEMSEILSMNVIILKAFLSKKKKKKKKKSLPWHPGSKPDGDHLSGGHGVPVPKIENYNFTRAQQI